jgi:signal-transduction protein with cAMP-binding, CBS, and nucleotidyltransferase domain
MEPASFQEAAKKMKDKSVSSMVVVDDGTPQDLVTERYLVTPKATPLMLFRKGEETKSYR